MYNNSTCVCVCLCDYYKYVCVIIINELPARITSNEKVIILLNFLKKYFIDHELYNYSSFMIKFYSLWSLFIILSMAKCYIHRKTLILYLIDESLDQI